MKKWSRVQNKNVSREIIETEVIMDQYWDGDPVDYWFYTEWASQEAEYNIPDGTLIWDDRFFYQS